MDKVKKSEAEWRSQLSPMEYSVTREKATERAFTGRYWDHHEQGIYRCVVLRHRRSSPPIPSSIRAAAGRATSKRSTRRTCGRSATRATG